MPPDRHRGPQVDDPKMSRPVTTSTLPVPLASGPKEQVTPAKGPTPTPDGNVTQGPPVEDLHRRRVGKPATPVCGPFSAVLPEVPS